MTKMGSPKDATAWNTRYDEGTARWDLGAAPPALAHLLETLGESANAGRPLRVLVPGCGYGHDALAWAAAGHEVVGLDFAPLAIEGARERGAAQGLTVAWELADVFALPEAFAGSFDVVWEQTCFCAIDVEDRDRYVAAMSAVLRPSGRYYGLFWNHGQPDGPPHDITRAEVEVRFAGLFNIESMDAVIASVASRSNEFLAMLVRK